MAKGPGRRVISVMFLLVVVVLSVSLNIYRAENQFNSWIEIESTDVSQPSCLNVGPTRSEQVPDKNSKVTIVTVIPKLFHCGGYALNRNLKPTLKSLLPEYEWVDLRRVSDWRGEELLVSGSHPWDIFVSNYQLDECHHPSFYQWLHLRFSGKVLFWTPEDATNYLELAVKPNLYPMGPGASLTLTFLQTAFWAQVPDLEKQEYFLGTPGTPPRRPRSTGTHFLIYAHSRCVVERQTAFAEIANYQGGIFPTVYHGGRCDGGLQTTNTTKVQKYPNKIRLDNWEDNRYLFKDFRFCLTMEHASTPGYITEKILVAFWAGCLPIYWGPEEEIADIFHSESFIYWDVNNPESALERIRYLEGNRSAYDETMSLPILAPGALERYFSMDDRYGGGALKATIRANLGLDVYRFVGEA
jgi:hypothetical protein